MVDVEKTFEKKMSAIYEKQLQDLRNQISELESIVNKNNASMNVFLVDHYNT